MIIQVRQQAVLLQDASARRNIWQASLKCDVIKIPHDVLTLDGLPYADMLDAFCSATTTYERVVTCGSSHHPN
jgi:hypothetical protein